MSLQGPNFIMKKKGPNMRFLMLPSDVLRNRGPPHAIEEGNLSGPSLNSMRSRKNACDREGSIHRAMLLRHEARYREEGNEMHQLTATATKGSKLKLWMDPQDSFETPCTQTIFATLLNLTSRTQWNHRNGDPRSLWPDIYHGQFETKLSTKWSKYPRNLQKIIRTFS